MALLRESNLTDDYQSYKPLFNKISFQLSNQKSALLQPVQNTSPATSQFFDGKRVRRSITRKTVDYNSSFIQLLEERKWRRDYRDIYYPQPDHTYSVELLPPEGYINNPINSVMTKFIRAATNKIKCPVFSVVWTPDGRRLITGASSGEFTLWSGLHFNFETILQAHDTSVRSMVWSHNDLWMVTADHGGYIKYWQSNMNNVKMFQAHKEAIRGLSFSPTDCKFASCADDGTVRIWDFERGEEEKILRGHGSDVKCLDWHPSKSLIASGSKDNQQPVKLWDPRSGSSLATIHSHKGTVMALGWNQFNGNWLITGSRDHSLKLFDVRNFKDEVQSFKGHKKDITSLAWHPIHESLFASGSADGTILYWTVGNEKDVGGIEQAHDSIIWNMSWHPMGHILVSGSNDHTTKFWTRNRPGDLLSEKDYQNQLLSASPIVNIEEFLGKPKISLQITDQITDGHELFNATTSPLKAGGEPLNLLNPQAIKDGGGATIINNASSFYIPGLDFFDSSNTNILNGADLLLNTAEKDVVELNEREVENGEGQTITTDHQHSNDERPYDYSYRATNNNNNQNEDRFDRGDISYQYDQNLVEKNFVQTDSSPSLMLPQQFNNHQMKNSTYQHQQQFQRKQDEFHVRNAPQPNNFFFRNFGGNNNSTPTGTMLLSGGGSSSNNNNINNNALINNINNNNFTGQQQQQQITNPNPLMAAAARFMLLQSQMRMATAIAAGLSSLTNVPNNNPPGGTPSGLGGVRNPLNRNFNQMQQQQQPSQNTFRYNQPNNNNNNYTDAFHYNAGKGTGSGSNKQQDYSKGGGNYPNKRFRYNKQNKY